MKPSLILSIVAIAALWMCQSCSTSTEPEIQTVAAPVITPLSGTYHTPLRIIINCDTEGAQVYYSLDDSEPSETSLLYTEPLILAVSATLKAKAYKAEYVTSPTVSESYTLVLPVVSTPSGDPPGDISRK